MTIKVYMKYPGVGGIGRVGDAYVKYLSEMGFKFVNDPKNADLRVGHAGISGSSVDVEHNHGLWWTSDMKDVRKTHWDVNARIIQALRAAKIVTVPSEWVRVNIARNMHISPRVVPHGIDWREWQHKFTPAKYILWNKARSKDVCDPSPVTALASKFRMERFVTTFCTEQLSNMSVTGRLPFEEMKPLVQKAWVYLATTPETFGLGTLEAMASGVPVLGYDWKGTADLIEHEKTGYLAEPGNIQDLAHGLAYCIRYRDRLGAAAREAAKVYTWQRTADMVAAIYKEALVPKYEKGVTVIIPSYMYAESVGRAIESCLRQTLKPKQIIVVDDGSPDSGATKRKVAKFTDNRVTYIRQENAGVAHARNHGISLARTELICCLDADDAIAPAFLEKLVPAFRDPLLGVAYTGLMLLSKNLTRRQQSGWPPDCNFNEQVAGKNQVPTCCVFRKRAWEEAGGYKQRYAPQGCGTEDAALWLSIGANGWRMKRVTNEPLFLYALGGRTWDKQNYVKTDWLAWHPFTKDRLHPFASIAKPNPHASHPVHQLDVPKVSVIVPVGPGHTDIVADALDSLEAQSFREWEVIVVNDSGEKLDLTPWPYATVIETPGKKGAGYARNRGTRIAKASEIVYLDADDFLQANALERFLLARHHHKDAWIYPDMYTHRANGSIEYYACSDFTAQELWRRGIAPVTCLYTKRMWERVGGFDEKSHREDWDFHLRLAKAGICGIRLPEALLTYRHKTGQRRISGSIRKEALILHDKYSREELMTRCGSCGKRAKLKRTSSTPPPTPANWTAKADLDWPKLEFTGNNQNDLLFKGKAGRRYLAGNNPHHKIIQVHPQDYQVLIRMRYFRPVQEEERVLLAESEPKTPPKSQWAPAIDITRYSLKKIKELDLTNQNLVKLIELEEAGKNRSTVLRHLRVLRRKRRSRNG